MAGKIDVNELRQTGYAYVNAANFMTRVAREQVLAQKAVDKHNESLKRAKINTQVVADLDDEIEKLKKMLELKRKEA